MDIVRFKGGLGNQMFQYAFAEALRSKGRDVYGNMGFYRKHSDMRPFVLNRVFQNIELPEIDDEIFADYQKKWEKVKTNEEELQKFLNNYKQRFFYVEEKDGTYDEHVFETEHCVFVGYWQTEKYFKNIRKQILKKFVFHIEEERIVELGEKLQQNYFSVHIRRGDYLNTPAIYGNICTLEYYNKAILYIEDKIPDAKFIFFSDDREWVQKHFHMKNMVFLDSRFFEQYQDWYDMYLMTKCTGNIIANSSFSWWGTWLNQNPNKIVIAPKKWLLGMETPDIWCDEWIRI